MFEWLKKRLGLDVILSNQIEMQSKLEEIYDDLDHNDKFERILDCLITIRDDVKEKDFTKMREATDKLEENIKRVNQMTLELKSVVSQSRAALNIAMDKQPRQ